MNWKTEVYLSVHGPPKPSWPAIEAVRARLLRDPRKIRVLGLGAAYQGYHDESLSSIAENRMRWPAEGQLLYQLALSSEALNILEIGMSLGVTTMYLSTANPKSKVWALEGCPETTKVAFENFDEVGCTNIAPVVGNFDETLEPTLDVMGTVDMVFIDGNHYEEPTMRYYYACLERMTLGGIMVFDDIRWSPGMARAWSAVKSRHENVTDVHGMGLVEIR